MADAVYILATRQCRVCLQNKEQHYFVKNKSFRSGIDTICLECSRQKVKEWRKNNPEKRKEQLKREYGKPYNHNKALKATYGITRDQYLELFNAQQGCCKICGKHQIEFKRRLSVDHCHITSKIRGLLCHYCNALLGYAKDNIKVLENAIEYLKETNG